MKITEITAQKNGTASNIYIDGEFSFSASFEDIVKLSIKEGMELDSRELENLIALCEYSKAYNYCLRLLGIKDYTSEEISKKLRQKSFAEKTIENVLKKLQDYNFINDNIYAEKYANDCLKIKKYGINKIKNSLVSKGINKDIINSLEINRNDQYRLCKEAAVKKKKIIGECKNRKEKIFRFLISRGFEYEIVSKVLNEIMKSDTGGEEEY